MADLLDDITVGALGNLFNHTMAGLAVAGVDTNLDQFVMLQRDGDLADDIVSDAVLANDHDDLTVVCLLA